MRQTPSSSASPKGSPVISPQAFSHQTSPQLQQSVNSGSITTSGTQANSGSGMPVALRLPSPGVSGIRPRGPATNAHISGPFGLQSSSSTTPPSVRAEAIREDGSSSPHMPSNFATDLPGAVLTSDEFADSDRASSPSSQMPSSGSPKPPSGIRARRQHNAPVGVSLHNGPSSLNGSGGADSGSPNNSPTHASQNTGSRQNSYDITTMQSLSFVPRVDSQYGGGEQTSPTRPRRRLGSQDNRSISLGENEALFYPRRRSSKNREKSISTSLGLVQSPLRERQEDELLDSNDKHSDVKAKRPKRSRTRRQRLLPKHTSFVKYLCTIIVLSGCVALALLFSVFVSNTLITRDMANFIQSELFPAYATPTAIPWWGDEKVECGVDWVLNSPASGTSGSLFADSSGTLSDSSSTTLVVNYPLSKSLSTVSSSAAPPGIQLIFRQYPEATMDGPSTASASSSFVSSEDGDVAYRTLVAPLLATLETKLLTETTVLASAPGSISGSTLSAVAAKAAQQWYASYSDRSADETFGSTDSSVQDFSASARLLFPATSASGTSVCTQRESLVLWLTLRVSSSSPISNVSRYAPPATLKQWWNDSVSASSELILDIVNGTMKTTISNEGIVLSHRYSGRLLVSLNSTVGLYADIAVGFRPEQVQWPSSSPSSGTYFISKASSPYTSIAVMASDCPKPSFAVGARGLHAFAFQQRVRPLLRLRDGPDELYTAQTENKNAITLPFNESAIQSALAWDAGGNYTTTTLSVTYFGYASVGAMPLQDWSAVVNLRGTRTSSSSSNGWTFGNVTLTQACAVENPLVLQLLTEVVQPHDRTTGNPIPLCSGIVEALQNSPAAALNGWFSLQPPSYAGAAPSAPSSSTELRHYNVRDCPTSVSVSVFGILYDVCFELQLSVRGTEHSAILRIAASASQAFLVSSIAKVNGALADHFSFKTQSSDSSSAGSPWLIVERKHKASSPRSVLSFVGSLLVLLAGASTSFFIARSFSRHTVGDALLLVNDSMKHFRDFEGMPVLKRMARISKLLVMRRQQGVEQQQKNKPGRRRTGEEYENGDDVDNDADDENGEGMVPKPRQRRKSSIKFVGSHQGANGGQQQERDRSTAPAAYGENTTAGAPNDAAPLGENQRTQVFTETAADSNAANPTVANETAQHYETSGIKRRSLSDTHTASSRGRSKLEKDMAVAYSSFANDWQQIFPLLAMAAQEIVNFRSFMPKRVLRRWKQEEQQRQQQQKEELQEASTGIQFFSRNQSMVSSDAGMGRSRQTIGGGSPSGPNAGLGGHYSSGFSSPQLSKVGSGGGAVWARRRVGKVGSFPIPGEKVHGANSSPSEGSMNSADSGLVSGFESLDNTQNSVVLPKVPTIGVEDTSSSPANTGSNQALASAGNSMLFIQVNAATNSRGTTPVGTLQDSPSSKQFGILASSTTSLLGAQNMQSALFAFSFPKSPRLLEKGSENAAISLPTGGYTPRPTSAKPHYSHADSSLTSLGGSNAMLLGDSRYSAAPHNPSRQGSGSGHHAVPIPATASAGQINSNVATPPIKGSNSNSGSPIFDADKDPLANSLGRQAEPLIFLLPNTAQSPENTPRTNARAMTHSHILTMALEEAEENADPDAGIFHKNVTVIYIKANIFPNEEPRFDPSATTVQESQVLIKTVLKIVSDFNGVLFRQTADCVIASWNAFTPYPFHELRGCLCALHVSGALNVRLPNTEVCVSITSSQLVIGTSGTTRRKFEVLVGDGMKEAEELAALGLILSIPVVLSEFTNIVVRHQMWTVPVDLLMDADGTTYTLFALRGMLVDRAQLHVNETAYLEGYAALCQQDFDVAAKRFRDHLNRTHTQHRAQNCGRLERICLYFLANQSALQDTPYVRRSPSWTFHESAMNLVEIDPEIKEMLGMASSGTSAHSPLSRFAGSGIFGHPASPKTGLKHATSDVEQALRQELESGECHDGNTTNVHIDENTGVLYYMPRQSHVSQEGDDEGLADTSCTRQRGQSGSPPALGITCDIANGDDDGSPDCADSATPGSISNTAAAIGARRNLAIPTMGNDLAPTIDFGDQPDHSENSPSHGQEHLGANLEINTSTNMRSPLGNSGASQLNDSIDGTTYLNTTAAGGTMAGALAQFADTSVITDRKGNRFKKSNKLLGSGAFGEVFVGMTSDGSLCAIKSMKFSQDELFDDKNGQRSLTPGLTGTAIAASMDGDDTTPRGASGGSIDDSVTTPQNATPTPRRLRREVRDFISEISLLSNLPRNQNIVRYLSYNIDRRGDTPHIYIMMEYVGGGSLSRLLNFFKFLPVSSAKRYLVNTTRGLQHLHANGIIHRDVGPNNILITIDGICKLTDFGCAAKLERLAQQSTGQTLIQGTPVYMSPEACCGDTRTASDVWSLGILAHVLLTGELPYKSEDVEDVELFMRRLGLNYENANLAQSGLENNEIGEDAAREDGSKDSRNRRFSLNPVQLQRQFSDSTDSPSRLPNKEHLTPLVPVLSEYLPAEAEGFVYQCLRLDPKDRPTAYAVLKHPFLLH